MTFAEAVAALDARSNYERSGRLTSPTLDRISTLVDVMAQPQRSYPAVHITGTNGKTTVARAVTEVLRAAGLAVGTYTSPHVESVRERLCYDGRPISEEDFARAWQELEPYLDLVDSKSERPATWFEATTALALSWFAEKSVDVAVIEVGLGGAWDATNVVDAQVAAMTRVGMDHAAVLGPGLTDIAGEKAGIVKPGSVVCTAEQEPEVAAVLRARCGALGAQIRAEGIAFELQEATRAVGGQELSLRIDRDRYRDLFVPLFGEHLARDVVLGAAAARAMLGDAVLDEDVLRRAFAALHVTGRMEIVRRRPLVVLDGAHNAPAAEALAVAMRASFVWERMVLVVSIMDDKDVTGVLRPLVPLANQLIVTRNTSPRAATTDRLAAEARTLGADPMIVQNVPDAISVAIEKAGEGDGILVTGSLYTVGEARPMLVQAP